MYKHEQNKWTYVCWTWSLRWAGFILNDHWAYDINVIYIYIYTKRYINESLLSHRNTTWNSLLMYEVVARRTYKQPTLRPTTMPSANTASINLYYLCTYSTLRVTCSFYGTVEFQSSQAAIEQRLCSTLCGLIVAQCVYLLMCSANRTISFFQLFIATMSISLQTSFNRIMKYSPDKYHVWGAPTRPPSRLNSR